MQIVRSIVSCQFVDKVFATGFHRVKVTFDDCRCESGTAAKVISNRALVLGASSVLESLQLDPVDAVLGEQQSADIEQSLTGLVSGCSLRPPIRVHGFDINVHY